MGAELYLFDGLSISFRVASRGLVQAHLYPLPQSIFELCKSSPKDERLRSSNVANPVITEKLTVIPSTLPYPLISTWYHQLGESRAIGGNRQCQ